MYELTWASGILTGCMKKEEKKTFLKCWLQKVLYCLYRFPSHFSRIDGDIISRGDFDICRLYIRQMMMQTPGRLLPALQHFCTLTTHPGKKSWLSGITYHHLVPSDEVWGLTQQLHIWYGHHTGLLTNQDSVVQLGIPSCHWWDQVLALDRKEYHSPPQKKKNIRKEFSSQFCFVPVTQVLTLQSTFKLHRSLA